MADSKALSQMYDRLESEIANLDDDQVFKATESLLAKLPNDKELQLCKIIAQLRLSKFENLESLFPKKLSLDDGNDLVYAYAYYLYKKARYDECLTFLQKNKFSDPEYKKGATLLEAQVKYKKGDLLEASKIFLLALEDQPIEIENAEVLSNLLNCLSQVPPGQTTILEKTLKLAKTYISENEESLVREFFYNLALLYTNIGNFTAAKEYLEKFKQFIDASEDATDTDSQQDLLMFQIQNDFIDSSIYDLSPEESEAKLNAYAKKLEFDISDYYKIALKNNLISFRDKSKELGDSIKKLDEVIKLAPKAELSQAQILDLKVNKLILYLVRNKYGESSKLIEEIEKTYQPTEYLANDKFVSCKYFLLFRTKKYKEVEELNQNLLSQLDKLSASSKLPILLVNGEINRLFGNQKILIENLTKIMDLDKRLVKNSALNALVLNTLSRNLNLLGDFQPLIKNIQTQVEDPKVISLIAELYIRDKKYDQAIKIYEQILTKDKDNQKALERLGYLYSFTDLKKAQQYLERIPQVDVITDPTELRRLEVDYLPSRGTKVEDAKADQTAVEKKKKRKRKPRYPKNFDPNNPGTGPDPERWVPRLERKKYIKMAKKKGLLRGTQGASAGQETVQTFQKGPSTANQEVAAGGAKAKKNKKKR